MKNLDMDHIAFIGRTLEEYMNIFDLSTDQLKAGKVLDCAAGPSSFTAEANDQGYDVSACDAMYDQDPLNLFKIGYRDIAYVFSKFDEVADNYTWDYYKDKDHVISCRKLSLGRFIKDFRKRKNDGTYTQTRLPELPYDDNSFNLVLSSHLLFLYGDRIGVDDHIASLREMLRVCAGEVRLYPLTGLDSEPYPDLNRVLAALDNDGISHEIIKVPFEFQCNSNRMLRILKNKG